MNEAQLGRLKAAEKKNAALEARIEKLEAENRELKERLLEALEATRSRKATPWWLVDVSQL